MSQQVDSFILGYVIRAIRHSFDARNIAVTSTTRFREDLALKSYEVVELAIVVEDLFDIELSRDAIEGFRSVADVAEHLKMNFFSEHAPASVHSVL